MVLNPTNPISIIKTDHETAKDLLTNYKIMDFDAKKSQAQKIAEELAIHMEMEESLFYPQVESISEEGEAMISDAEGEHEEIRGHIVQALDAFSEEDLDGHMQIIEETVLRHAGEEEAKILPLAEAHLVDNFTKMAAEMIAFKAKNKGKILLEKLKSVVS